MLNSATLMMFTMEVMMSAMTFLQYSRLSVLFLNVFLFSVDCVCFIAIGDTFPGPTKEAPNCATFLLQLTALLTPLVSSDVLFSDLKTSYPQIQMRLWPDLSS